MSNGEAAGLSAISGNEQRTPRFQAPFLLADVQRREGLHRVFLSHTFEHQLLSFHSGQNYAQYAFLISHVRLKLPTRVRRFSLLLCVTKFYTHTVHVFSSKLRFDEIRYRGALPSCCYSLLARHFFLLSTLHDHFPALSPAHTASLSLSLLPFSDNSTLSRPFQFAVI